MVAVPSLSLLAQTLESWARDSTDGLDDWLAVCSDPTVADAPDTSEMPSVTTDPADVTAWLRRPHRRGRQRVVFVTHASLPVLADALDTANRRADLLLVDEAHRVAGRGALAQLATGREFPTRRRLFLTATPRVYTAQAKSKADGEGVDVISMDDEDRFGPEAHHLSFAQAVDLGLLVDFEIVVSIITDTDIAHLVDQRVIGELAGVEADMGTLAAHVAVARALHEWDAKRTISFHTRIGQAADFAAHHAHLAHLVNPDETVIAEATSGKVPAGVRRAALDRLAELSGGADRRLLTNARVLSEGVDVPTVDAVAFIDPRRSVIDIAQAVGRAMRTAPDKTRGLVVVPVHLPAGADPDTIADNSAWKPVWDTLRALKAIDERLTEQLDQLRFHLGRQRTCAGVDRLHFLSAEPVSAAFVDAITAQAVRLTTGPWEQWFGVLVAYVEENGHACPPADYVADGAVKLGIWVGTQRGKRTQLSESQRSRLESLPGWEWDARKALWDNGIAHLRAYVDEQGHARVPVDYVTVDGFRLGQWASSQRGRHDAMPQERRARLGALPGWTWDPFEDLWETQFAAVAAFVAEQGHARVPRSYVSPAGYKLGTWVQGQRDNRDEMPDDRRIRLEALDGWEWDPNASGWEEAFAALVMFVNERGQGNVPARHRTADGFPLGRWVSKQRSSRREGRLSPEREARLAAVDGWAWDPRAATWEVGFRALERYVAEHGHAGFRVNHVTVDGFRLGQWANGQRAEQRLGRLSPEREARLAAVDGWAWDPHAAAWEQGFSALSAYVAENGDARVPQKYECPDRYPLGNWVSTQRAFHQSGNLSAERATRLETLPGWSWNALEARWEDGHSHLVAYAEQYGHTRVAQHYLAPDGYTLGRWVHGQRQAHWKHRLSSEHEARLEALPGWWWGGSISS